MGFTSKGTENKNNKVDSFHEIRKGCGCTVWLRRRRRRRWWWWWWWWTRSTENSRCLSHVVSTDSIQNLNNKRHTNQIDRHIHTKKAYLSNVWMINKMKTEVDVEIVDECLAVCCWWEKSTQSQEELEAMGVLACTMWKKKQRVHDIEMKKAYLCKEFGKEILEESGVRSWKKNLWMLF